MKQVTNKEYDRYQQYIQARLYGRILTPDGLRLICASFNNDLEQSGKHRLETLAKFKAEGIAKIKKWLSLLSIYGNHQIT